MSDNRIHYKRFNDRDQKFNEKFDDAYFERQHSKGKLTAIERIDILLDEDSFVEIDAFALPLNYDGDDPKAIGDGVICGYGKINNRDVLVYAQDFTYQGGSLGTIHAEKIQKVQDLGLRMGHPVIGLIDSGGARIQEGIGSLAGYGGIFMNNVKSSGVIPQISVILGPAAGGAVYSPALTDFIFMTRKTAYMFVTGPNVVKEVLNEDTTSEKLGGADVHSNKSGVADFIYDDEEHTLLGVRKLLSYLPSNNVEQPPMSTDTNIIPDGLENISKIIPDDSNKPYDVIEIIDRLVDKGSFFEVAEGYAQSIVTGLARLNNQVIGIVANQPKHLAGTLDIDSSRKAARFVRFCDAFHVPILVLEDVPGFLPGIDQEHAAIIKHGAKLLFAFAEASVPKITVILRKAYGGAYIVMNSNKMGGDFNFAWPTAEIAVMGPEGAVKILNRKEIAASDNPEELRRSLILKYKEEVANPYIADQKGYIDEVILPETTREKLIKAFALLENKFEEKSSKKHGNIPL